jgi:cold-inducible RNA-binding protein
MNIYIGRLAPSTTEEQIRALFEEHGTVESVKLIKDRLTGGLRGFAFVEMPSADEANQAIAELNGKEVSGNKIIVNEARPVQQDRAPRSRFGNDRGPRRTGGRDFGNGGSRNGGSHRW